MRARMLRIERERAMLDVPDVELDALGPGQRGASVDLRPARQAGPHLEPAPLALVVALEVRRRHRARADEAHLAAQDVPELGQLVDRRAPQERADARDARIARLDDAVAAQLLGVDGHRAQLEHLEALARRGRAAPAGTAPGRRPRA